VPVEETKVSKLFGLCFAFYLEWQWKGNREWQGTLFLSVESDKGSPPRQHVLALGATKRN